MNYLLRKNDGLSEWILIGIVNAFMFYMLFLFSNKKTSKNDDNFVNLKIEKDKPKVVNKINISQCKKGEKLVMCRCWKSKKFPYCDQTHVKHNKETGDNVGPLIIENTNEEED